MECSKQMKEHPAFLAFQAQASSAPTEVEKEDVKQQENEAAEAKVN